MKLELSDIQNNFESIDHGIVNRMITSLIEQTNAKIEEITRSRILMVCPDFDFEKQKTARFKRLICEVRGDITSLYFNDGTDTGIHLYSYIIETTTPEASFLAPPSRIYMQIVEVPDPSKM